MERSIDMAIPLVPTNTIWTAYFPPGEQFDPLWEAQGFHKRWPNFTKQELQCKGDGSLLVHYETMDALQKLRQLYSGPIVINSYYRSEWYNRKVGGAEASYHMLGRAIDTPTLNGTLEGRMKLCHLATRAGFNGFGLYGSFTHIDTGPMRFWTDGLMNDLHE